MTGGEPLWQQCTYSIANTTNHKHSTGSNNVDILLLVGQA